MSKHYICETYQAIKEIDSKQSGRWDVLLLAIENGEKFSAKLESIQSAADGYLRELLLVQLKMIDETLVCESNVTLENEIEQMLYNEGIFRYSHKIAHFFDLWELHEKDIEILEKQILYSKAATKKEVSDGFIYKKLHQVEEQYDDFLHRQEILILTLQAIKGLKNKNYVLLNKVKK